MGEHTRGRHEPLRGHDTRARLGWDGVSHVGHTPSRAETVFSLFPGRNTGRLATACPALRAVIGPGSRFTPMNEMNESRRTSELPRSSGTRGGRLTATIIHCSKKMTAPIARAQASKPDRGADRTDAEPKAPKRGHDPGMPSARTRT